MEVFRREWFPGFTAQQVNISYSHKNVLRGLHYHREQTDVWWPIQGRFQVAFVQQQPTHLVESFIIDSREPIAIKIPPNVSHGYLALDSACILGYAVDQVYNPEDEFTIPWNHQGIAWKVETPILSERDNL